MKRVARLLDTIRPSRYTLTVEPEFDDFTFFVREVMEFDLPQPTKAITLHSVDLELLGPVVTMVTAGQVEPTGIDIDKEAQTATLTFDRELSGSGSLELGVRGKLRDDLHGFYKSSYKDKDGTERWLATTQFEPTAAREAFVCVDEPAAKAVFDITMIIPENLEAISNTNIVDTGSLEVGKDKADAAKNKKKTVHFAPTPKMSTYLLAFLVGDFERKTKTTEHGVEVGVYTTAGKIHQAEFALEVAAKTLDFYDDYFGIPYPLPKLDMIAVPDFAAGAMENWGAVTYREPAILVDPGKTALANKQFVAMVVAHELAHQWFGNLVTMTWWTDLWLNEGFASWVEYLAVDHLYPEWEMWTQFVANDYNEARQLDSLANTHPIEVEVHHPDEIGEIFDAISYQKGASVIRMLYHFLGPDVFKTGLHNYLKAFSYSNAVTNDLWQHLAEASQLDVTKIMQAWTKQPGFPLVTLTDGKITQERFYSDPKAKPKQAKDDTVWPVPLAFATTRGVSSPILVDHAEGQLASDNNGWEKPNAEQTGVYLVNYSAQQLERLRAAFDELSIIDRWGVISDMSMLMPSGHISAGEYLKFVAALRYETNYAVWLAILDGLGSIFVLANESTLDKLEKFTVWLLEPIVERLGWDAKPKESHLDSLLRAQVLGLAGRCGDQNVIAEARQRFDNHRAGQELPADLRGPVYGVVAKHGDQDAYGQLTQLLEQEVLQEEERRLLGALSRFKHPDLVKQTLERSVSDKVRSQDSLLVIVAVLGNRYGRDMAWEFIKDNWKLFVKRYGSGGHLLSRLPEAIGTVYARHDHALEVERFFDANDKPGVERTIQQALEQIRLQADWWERDKDSINAYLDSNWKN